MVTQEELEKMSPEEIAQLQRDNCIFCKIIRGEIPSKKVYEDDVVVAILDINPAKKGHVLVMPKEHFPILPLIPPEIFEKIFLATKFIAQGIRKAMLVKETTIFIANGAVAGQQSPHFLFHILPRDEGEILTNFNLQENPLIKSEQKSIESSLKNNLNIMLSKIISSPSSQVSKQSSEEKESTKDAKNLVDLMAKKQELIAQILEEHEDVRTALIEDPISFREQLKGNPKLEKLFDGIDVETLSKQLKSSFQEIDVVDEKESKNKLKDKKDSLSSENSLSSKSKDTKPEVFFGLDPLKQKSNVFDYFKSKPKAKKLLVDDPDYFIELLENRPDVKELFTNVDIKLLSEKLKNHAGDLDE